MHNAQREINIHIKGCHKPRRRQIENFTNYSVKIFLKNAHHKSSLELLIEGLNQNNKNNSKEWNDSCSENISSPLSISLHKDCF